MSTATLPRLGATPPETATRTPWREVGALAVALSLLLAGLLAAFAWPATHSRPRDLPVAVAGPPQAVAQVRAALEHARPGAFEVRTVPDAATARERVADRTVDGALVLGPGSPRVVVATQGGPAVAQLLTEVARAASGGPAVAVEDVAPAPAADPHGAGLPAGTLPLALAGVGAGAVLALRVRGGGQRAAGGLVFSAAGGLLAVGVLHGWLGALTGSWAAEAGVLALGLAAVTLAVLGMAAIAGRPGLGLTAAVVVALGNPLSAAAAAPELLPPGWSQLGQLLPPGAVVAALRAVSGFGGTGVTGPVTVLAGWAAGGLALVGLAALRRRPLPRKHAAALVSAA
jgi:hypothetical protein